MLLKSLCGGWVVVVVCKPILVFSLSLGQAEQYFFKVLFFPTISFPFVTVITWPLRPFLRGGRESHCPVLESKNSTEVMLEFPLPRPPETTKPGRPLILA